jgi:hypothetical protein
MFSKNKKGTAVFKRLYAGALLVGAEYAGIFHDFLNSRCRALFSMDGYQHVSGGLNLISEFLLTHRLG